MDKNERRALLKVVGDVVKEYVAATQEKFWVRVQEFVEERVKAIPAGPPGKDGVDGKDGRDGVDGQSIEGPAGKDGQSIQGPAGKDGESIKGDPGEPGPPGKDAEPLDMAVVEAMINAAAMKIIAGMELKNGAPGKDGMPGRDGKDADVEQIRGFIAEETQKAVAAIPKAKDGEPGKPGLDGKPGKDAEPIHPDTITLMVTTELQKAMASIPKAVDGKDGKDGLPGKDGESVHPDSIALMMTRELQKALAEIRLPKDGEPGRDAIDTPPIEIDVTRSYPRGTYGFLDGGVMYSLRQTDPLEGSTPQKSGWRVAQQGVAHLSIEQGEDPRDIIVKCRLTGCEERVEKYHYPGPLDKGIWKDGSDYLAGDIVTWDGSGWVCREDLTKSKPGDGVSGWRLFVKRGVDGKNYDPNATNGNKKHAPISLR